MNNNEKYLQFPLFLMRDLIFNKEHSINDIIKYGLYRCAKRIDCDLIKVARQLMYDYYRHKGKLTSYLYKSMNKFIKNEELNLNEDYDGFSSTGKEFLAEIEIDELHQIFANNPEFKERAIEYYQMHAAYEFLGVTGNTGIALERAKEIEQTISKNEPMPMVRKTLLFDFRDQAKSEEELIQFAAYLGVRSILGKKDCCKTNKNLIVSRMFGYSSIKQIPNNLQPPIKVLYDKFSKRYHIDNLLQELELKWNVMNYSNHLRGMYVGIEGKITREEMITIAETHKKKNKVNKLKHIKNETKEKVLKQMNQPKLQISISHAN